MVKIRIGRTLTRFEASNTELLLLIKRVSNQSNADLRCTTSVLCARRVLQERNYNLIQGAVHVLEGS
jgi:hypothetical protein